MICNQHSSRASQTVLLCRCATCTWRAVPTMRTLPRLMNAVHHESTLYERLATQLAGLIHAETLRPGDRLPSVRSLSEQQRVSVSTVLQAYVLLENRGLIETRPQSGHYVRPRLLTLAAEPKMSRPSTMATRPSVTDLVAKVYGATRDPSIVPLGAAYPSAHVLPTA